jgi:hypothetical protein
MHFMQLTTFSATKTCTENLIDKEASMANDMKKPDRDWIEELTVTGQELVERIKKLVAEGNVRRLIIRKPNGENLLEIPLTAGVVAGGAFTIMAPVLAALGALAALLTEFKIEVIRTDQPGREDDE